MAEYPGGKNGAGTYQRIINHMPPHTRYIEPFVGSGAILRNKKQAESNIAIDIDAAAIAQLKMEAGLPFPLMLESCNSIDWINDHKHEFGSETLIYADPPYMMDTRRSHRQIYFYEMTDEDHVKLLDVLCDLKCMVIVSGYWSELYDHELNGWRVDTWQTMTRGGTLATEWLWMNYPQPLELHDYRYIGANFRDRERIKRKVSRWKTKLQTMSHNDRIAIMAAIEEVKDETRKPISR